MTDRPLFLSRRRFLTGTMSTGLITLIGPSLLHRAHAAEACGCSPGSEVLTGTHWGVVRAKIEGGRFVKATPFEGDPFPMSLVKATPAHVYSPSRVKYPMVRAGFLESGHKSDTRERGKGAFVRVSWDNALDLVASELKRVKAQHGPASVYGASGWKSSGKLHNCASGLTRLLNLNGGFSTGTGGYSTAASQTILPHVMGGMEVSGEPTYWPVVIESSDLVVVWGGDPMTTLAVGWGMPDHAAYDALRELKESKKKVIVIDPVRCQTAEYLSAEWIAPRPGSDVAMMLGIAHTLLTEKLFDQEFLDEYTVGFEPFKAYLTGKKDGQAKTADWAAKVCEVDADVIRGLARRMAKGRTMLMSGWGMQRADHGEQVHWMLVTVASMLGQIGLPGGGFGLSYHFGGAGVPPADGAVLGGLSGGAPPDGAPAAIPSARITDALLNPGRTIDFNGAKVTYPDIKLIYWAGGNPFHHLQDRNKLVKAWRRPETVIIQEQFWTASAKFADIVLPATTSFERNDIEMGGDYSRRYIFPMHKVIEPLFEARSDYDIFAAVAERLGVREAFTEGKSEMEWLASIYKGAQRQAAVKRLEMPNFPEFWQSGTYVEFPVRENAKKWVRHADFREDPLLEPLGTPSGKIEIYSKNVEKLGYEDCPPHPTWMEPAEWLGSEKAEKHPLHLLSPHPTHRLHSQFNQSPLRKKYEIAGREPVWISKPDAKARSIQHGDVVRVFNDRGQVLAGAFVTDRLRPGVVRLCEGAWYDPMEPGEPGTLCKYGDVNVLTLDRASSKLSQATIANTALVEIEKYEDTPPAVTAFEPPGTRSVPG
jgi:trimethylamine-N-oxide reductase (cytochrome c)